MSLLPSHPLIPLLYCPKCPPRTILSMPVTRRSGLTICAQHPVDDDDMEILLPTPQDSILPPPHSPSVSFRPTPVATVPSFKSTSGEVKVDVTVNKVLHLVHKYLSHDLPYLHEPFDSSHTSPSGSEPGTPSPVHCAPVTGIYQGVLDRFQAELLSELACEICFSPMYKPITTPCQHTFCADCLQRSIDHSTICPLCRQDLPGYAYFQFHPCNKLISNIVETIFPATHQERAEAVTAEVDARLDTPIFVCTLSLPGLPTLLQIFEPKYRLMLRRCLEAAEPRFGMIMSESSEFGTMLEVRSVQMLPDGRSIVETWGASRFRVVERGSRDGYMVGRVEFFEDMSLEEELAALPEHAPTVSDLMQVCNKFLDELRAGAKPWVLQRIGTMSAYMPEDDPAMFSFWMALVLPLHDKEKAKLLSIRSVQMRLQVIVRWISQFHDSWYAQWLNHGCVVC